jgi:hypothetical protein
VKLRGLPLDLPEGLGIDDDLMVGFGGLGDHGGPSSGCSVRVRLLASLRVKSCLASF